METIQEKKEREEKREEYEAGKNLELFLELCKQMDDKNTTQKLNDIIGNKKKTLLYKQTEAKTLFGQTLDAQLTNQQNLLDELSTKHSDLKRLEEEQLKRLKEEQNLDEDKKSEKIYEYFIIIPNNFKNEQLAPYSSKNTGYFSFGSKNQTTDDELDHYGFYNTANLNWFNDKGFYLFNNDTAIQDVHTDQIKQKDIEHGYKYVITDFKLSYLTAKLLKFSEKHSSVAERTQTPYDVASLSIVLPYESRLVDLYETFLSGPDSSNHVENERILNHMYVEDIRPYIDQSNIEDANKRIQEQEQKINNNPIQKYDDLIDLIKKFDKVGLYQLLRATHKTMQKIQQEYKQAYEKKTITFWLFLEKTKLYQRFFTDTLNVLKEKINQKNKKKIKKIQNNKNTNNKINITNHPENIQLKNNNRNIHRRTNTVRRTEAVQQTNTDQRLPIVPQKELTKQINMQTARTKQINIHKEITLRSKTNKKNMTTTLPFITKDSVKKYHKQKNVEARWLKYGREKIDKIDQKYKEDDKQDKTNKDKISHGCIMNLCHHTPWWLVGGGKKHFSKT